jgi:hypothetical protein
LGCNDRIGGALDRLFDELRGGVAGLVVERIQVTYPGDDDNVFFLRDGRGIDEVQIDTHPHGQLPFYPESDTNGLVETTEVTEALAIVRARLQG